MVETVRRTVERALPWFDVAAWRRERDRQATIVRQAHESDRAGRAVIDEYHRIARMRR